MWQLIRDHKAGVMIVGEAHLNPTRHRDIENLFGRCLKVEFSEDPHSPNTAGLAFVINKNLMRTDNMKITHIIPGRAMILELDWHAGHRMSILGVYAPNAAGENEQFWKDIKQFLVDNPGVRKPDAMGGDHNIVEEATDRIPAHEDSAAAVAALDSLKSYLGMVDGWRNTYPTTRAYTYHQ
ncbi:hypothetical protein C8R47DRAFT_980237, partial [Mycena vitilis]